MNKYGSRKLKVKEVKEMTELTRKELISRLTEEQQEKIERIFGFMSDFNNDEYSQFLYYFEDAATVDGLKDNEYYCSIDLFLESMESMFIEEIEEYYKEIN